jgi:hypothetical protein
MSTYCSSTWPCRLRARGYCVVEPCQQSWRPGLFVNEVAERRHERLPSEDNDVHSFLVQVRVHANGLLFRVAYASSLISSSMLAKVMILSSTRAPLFQLREVSLLWASTCLSEAAPRTTVSDSWASTSSGEEAIGGVQRDSLEPMSYLPMARLTEKMVWISS